MVKTELVTVDEETVLRSYSDAGFYIHGGVPEGDYVEADDPVGSGRTYVETNRPIIPNEEVKDYATVALILMGGELWE